MTGLPFSDGRERADKIAEYRRQQPIDELRRKQRRARRKDIWTEEDIDLAFAEADELSRAINWD